MSLLYDKVVNIINKEPEERQDAEIEQILPWFRKRSELFNSLHTDIVKDIVKNCKFKQSVRDDVIIRQMEKGDCFYVILSGQVAIHINTTLTEEEFEGVLKTQLDEEAAVAKDPKKERELDRSKYGIYVGKIDAGKSFGELALINADCVRNASIIADEPTDLLSVDRDLYNRSLRAFQAHEFQERKDFVASFLMFNNWAPRYRKMMAFSLKKKVLKFEDTVVKQGAQVDGIHFIIKGQVKVRVDPSQHSSQYPQMYPLGDIADLEREKARELLRKEMNLQRHRAADRRSQYQRRAVIQPDTVKKKDLQPLELCLAGAIDVIGDLEMAMGLNTYSETVECTEEAVIYHLDQRNYDRLIEKRNPAALEMLKDIVHTKLALHFSRLHDDVIPLYRFLLYTLDEKEKDARRSAAASRRSRTPHSNELHIDNLQKGPLINMYGPGSVFYLIRKKAKELKARQKKRQNNPQAPRFNNYGLNHKAPPAAMALAAARGLLFSNPVTNANDSHDGAKRAPSPTESMLNLYGVPEESHVIHGIDDPEFMDDARRGFYTTEGYDLNDLDFEEGFDFASSDMALCQLEDRLSQWHNSLGIAQKGTCVVPLRRYNGEEENKPKPGNKVYVKVRSKPKAVSFFAFQNTNDDLSSPEEVPKTQGSRSPISSLPLLETITKDSDVRPLSANAGLPMTSPDTPRPRSSKSEITSGEIRRKKKRKQYTIAEYQALKAELRRRQKAWISHLPTRSNTFIF